jgi:hypothetical protein
VVRLSRNLYTIEGDDGFVDVIPMPIHATMSLASMDVRSTDPVSMDGASMDVRSGDGKVMPVFIHTHRFTKDGVEYYAFTPLGYRTRRRKHHHKKYMRLYRHRFDSLGDFWDWLEFYLMRRI